MDADEVGGANRRFGQAGDRQGRRVGPHDRRIGELGLSHLGDLGLQFRILEHGLDDKVSALEVVIIGGRLDQGEERVALLLGHLAARHVLLDELAGIVFPFFGILDRDIDEDGLDSGARLFVGDAGAHQAGADDGDLVEIICREASRAVGALGQGLRRQEQRADHRLGFRALLRVDEVARLDAQAGIDRYHDAFIDAGQDILLGRIIAIGLGVQHGIGHGHDLAGAGAAMRDAAGNLESLDVPRGLGGRVGLDPSCGLCLGFG